MKGADENLTKLAKSQAEVVRLTGLIQKNKVAFQKLKRQAQQYRDRALRAEAALAEARRVPPAPRDPVEDMLNSILRGKK